MAAHIANCGDITVREFIREFRGMTGSEAEGSSATALFEPIENGAGIFGKMEPAWLSGGDDQGLKAGRAAISCIFDHA